VLASFALLAACSREQERSPDDGGRKTVAARPDVAAGALARAAGLEPVAAPGDVSVPRVVGLEPSVARPINAALDERRRAALAEAAECRAAVGPGGGHYSLTTAVAYNDDGLLSLRFEGDSFCGGANGTPLRGAATFDLRTGKAVDVAAQTTLGREALATLALPHYTGGEACAAVLRDRALAPLGDVFLARDGLAVAYDVSIGAAEGCSLPPAVVPADVAARHVRASGPVARAWRRGPAAARRVPPVDDCGGDPSLQAYRARLNDAVRQKSVAGLRALVDPNVLIDFGGGVGRAAFEAHWRLDRPAESPLWSELRIVLGLGCRIIGAAAVAPSLGDLLPDDVDPFNTVVAIGGAPLRSAPREGSPIVVRLDWDLLVLADEDLSKAWLPIALPDGRRGFVRQADVRSPLDYRATFEKRPGGWTMTQFVSGD